MSAQSYLIGFKWIRILIRTGIFSNTFVNAMNFDKCFIKSDEILSAILSTKLLNYTILLTSIDSIRQNYSVYDRVCVALFVNSLVLAAKTKNYKYSIYIHIRY